ECFECECECVCVCTVCVCVCVDSWPVSYYVGVYVINNVDMFEVCMYCVCALCVCVCVCSWPVSSNVGVYIINNVEMFEVCMYFVCVCESVCVCVCVRSEEHTSELQSHLNLVCRLLLEHKKNYMLSPACTFY